MPVVGFRFFLVKPLLQLPLHAHLVRGDPVGCAAQPGSQLRIAFKETGGFRRGAHQVANNLMVHGRAHDQSALLRRVGRTGDQPTGERVLDQETDQKLGALFHHGVGTLFEEHFVL